MYAPLLSTSTPGINTHQAGISRMAKPRIFIQT
jgi:hypothetical protein